MDVKTGGPAFPYIVEECPGMTLRDYFAGIAMGGTAGLRDDERLVFARNAYAMADAMLKVRASG